MRLGRVVTTRSRPAVMTLPDDMGREGLGPGPLPAAMLAIAEQSERLDDLSDRLTDYGARLLAVEQLLDDNRTGPATARSLLPGGGCFRGPTGPRRSTGWQLGSTRSTSSRADTWRGRSLRAGRSTICACSSWTS